MMLSKTFDLEVTNNGVNIIERGEIAIRLNGETIDTVDWFLDLETSEQNSITYDLLRNVEEDNVLEATFLNTDTSEEFSPDDNTDGYTFSNNILGVPAILRLTTDQSPQETSWEVLDQETGEIIESGGPYLIGAIYLPCMMQAAMACAVIMEQVIIILVLAMT